MKRPKTSIDQLGQKKLTASVSDAIGKVELVIETERSGQIIRLCFTRQKGELTVQWGRMVTLFLTIFKFWS